MLISTVGVVLLGVACLGVLDRRLFAAALAASAVFPTTAAVTVGGLGNGSDGTSIAPFYVLGIAAMSIAAWTWVTGKGITHSAWRALIWFTTAAIVITVIAPTLFRDTPILLPRGGIDTEVFTPSPLEYNSSIIAQIGYLIIAAGVVTYFTQRPWAAGALRTTFLVGVGIGAVDLGFRQIGRPWPEHLFRNFAQITYNDYDTRFHSVFSEPSYLAVFSIAAIAFFAASLARNRGRRAVNVVMLVLAVSQAALSGSGTAALAGVLVAVFAGGVHFLQFLAGRRKISPVVMVGVPLGLVVAVFFTSAGSSIADIISSKAGSGSAAHRFASDRFSLDLLGHTHGLGVGLGANRPSSFLTMLLSCVGIIGTLLFVIVVFRALRGRFSDPAAVPIAWSLVALLTAKAIADPALSTPLLWITLGTLLASSVAQSTSTDRSTGDADVPDVGAGVGGRPRQHGVSAAVGRIR